MVIYQSSKKVVQFNGIVLYRKKNSNLSKLDMVLLNHAMVVSSGRYM